MALASLTIANTYAVDPGFRFGNGIIATHVDAPITIEQVDQTSLRGHWTVNYKTHTGSKRSDIHTATFYLNNKTTFSGGSRSDAVKGRQVHITYHFEGDRAIADTIKFV